MHRNNLFLALVIAVAALPAQAQLTTFDYQGGIVTGQEQDTNLVGIVTSRDFSLGPLSGLVVLNGPLASNAVDATVTPVSWRFGEFDSASFAEQAPGATESASFLFTTSHDTIVNWTLDISFGPQLSTNTTGVTTYTSFGPGTAGHSLGQDLYSREIAGPGGSQVIHASSNGPGVWSKAVNAPEIDPASTLNALTFLIGSVVVLRGRRTPAKSCKPRIC